MANPSKPKKSSKKEAIKLLAELATEKPVETKLILGEEVQKALTEEGITPGTLSPGSLKEIGEAYVKKVAEEILSVQPMGMTHDTLHGLIYAKPPFPGEDQVASKMAQQVADQIDKDILSDLIEYNEDKKAKDGFTVNFTMQKNVDSTGSGLITLDSIGQIQDYPATLVDKPAEKKDFKQLTDEWAKFKELTSTKFPAFKFINPYAKPDPYELAVAAKLGLPAEQLTKSEALAAIEAAFWEKPIPANLQNIPLPPEVGLKWDPITPPQDYVALAQQAKTFGTPSWMKPYMGVDGKAQWAPSYPKYEAGDEASLPKAYGPPYYKSDLGAMPPPKEVTAVGPYKLLPDALTYLDFKYGTQKEQHAEAEAKALDEYVHLISADEAIATWVVGPFTHKDHPYLAKFKVPPYINAKYPIDKWIQLFTDAKEHYKKFPNQKSWEYWGKEVQTVKEQDASLPVTALAAAKQWSALKKLKTVPIWLEGYGALQVGTFKTMGEWFALFEEQVGPVKKKHSLNDAMAQWVKKGGNLLELGYFELSPKYAGVEFSYEAWFALFAEQQMKAKKQKKQPEITFHDALFQWTQSGKPVDALGHFTEKEYTGLLLTFAEWSDKFTKYQNMVKYPATVKAGPKPDGTVSMMWAEAPGFEPQFKKIEGKLVLGGVVADYQPGEAAVGTAPKPGKTPKPKKSQVIDAPIQGFVSCKCGKKTIYPGTLSKGPAGMHSEAECS